MKRSLACAWILGLALCFGPTSTLAGCDSSDRTFICGVENAEDLVRLGGTPWVSASSLNLAKADSEGIRWGPGPLTAIHIETREIRRLYPTDQVALKWDREAYPDCRTPPAEISPHGMSVRPLPGDAMFRLYVVNHAGRQSIEVIDIEVRGSRLTAAWRGCFLAPDGMVPNAVVALPDDALAVSGGTVAVRKRGGSWTAVDGITRGDGFGSNGIEVSRDGRWLFVAMTTEGSVVRVPVAGGKPQTVFKSEFLTDNLRWGENGRLYVAAFAKSDKDCLKAAVCDVGFALWEIDTQKLAAKEVVRSSGVKDAFGAATVGLQVGETIWLGSFRANRLLVLPLRH